MKRLDNSDRTTVAVIILIGLLLLLFLYSYSDADEKTYADIALNTLMVFVTTVYAFITLLILSDSKKTREIDYKRTQLEMFYYPLNKLLNPPHPVTVVDAIDSVYSYQYLATRNTKELFNEYLNARRCTDAAAILEETATRIDLKNAVDSDIDSLLHELNELIQ
jgi:hypothetical protein